ncbi:MAG TPA: hypothetical protein VGO90_02475 [Chthoniobacteraceae bacterium]|jgi:hypothetical protein|nr:hypothetical protein [Chthoniobacter sp.]HEV7866518.1 hypothetical protein [Chthoniobacteraceae bacterium]
MSKNNNPTTSDGPGLEDGFGSIMQSVREGASRRLTEYEGTVRESPGTALLCALGVGYVLRSVPVLGLIATLVRLTVSLLKPVALIYGAVKLYEGVQRSAADRS